MAKCGCAGSGGNVLIEGRNGVTVTGIGTAVDPYIIEAVIPAINETVLQFEDSATINFTSTGNGTPSSPRSITASIIWPTTGGLPVPVYTTALRPAANTVGVGRMIWNSTTKEPNFSDGVGWFDGAGAAA